jgi:HEAT repeat protein
LPADRRIELKDFALRRQEPSFTRTAAIETLGNGGDPGLRDFMQSQAHEASSDVAAAAIRALGRIGHPASAEVVIRAMRQTKHNHLRADAAEAAGRIGAPDFLGPLATMLSDDTWTVRYAAGRALRAIPGGIELLKRLGNGTASRQQRMASLVLSEGEAK